MVKEYSREEGLIKMKELVDSIHTCMFITNANYQNHVRPMATIRTDDNGCLWFFSEIQSDIVGDIKINDAVHLLYSHPGKEAYLDIRGIASIEINRDKIEEFCSATVKASFPGGLVDQDICLVKVEPENVYYWDSGDNKMTFLLKTVASAISGKKSTEGEEGILIH